MKKYAIAPAIFLFGSFLFMSASLPENHSEVTGNYVYPDNVKTILDNSCWGCHSAKGQSDKAKKALRWDTFGDLSKAKKVATLDAIIEVLENEEMPPEKFLEKYPDAKPSQKDVATLLKWANNETDKLMGE